MALIKQEETKQYATDTNGMMLDAISYASRDLGTFLEVIAKLKLNVSEDKITETLVQVKFEQIKKARTEKPSYMTKLEQMKMDLQ